MSPSAQRDLAEDVALVTVSLLNALDHYDEAQLPNGYRFDLFGGCPGFCDHAAAAGLALHDAIWGYDTDHRLDQVAMFAARVVAYAVDRKRPADQTTLASLATLVVRTAVRDGIIVRNAGRRRPL
jgi:hypothetical protein